MSLIAPLAHNGYGRGRVKGAMPAAARPCDYYSTLRLRGGLTKCAFLLTMNSK